jgi:hypothetical protein
MLSAKEITGEFMKNEIIKKIFFLKPRKLKVTK